MKRLTALLHHPRARWPIFAAVFALIAALLLTRPRAEAGLYFALILLAGLAVALRQQIIPLARRVAAHLRRHLRGANAELHTPSLAVTLSRNIPLPLLLAELGFIVYMALSAADAYLVDDPTQKLPGVEAEWLTSFAYLAANTLHEHGYIPLWQPHLEYGEPLVDNPFSFVLNPLSIVPSLLYGGLRGIKLSVALTAVVAGLGGWFLGRMLGFGPLGRVLLGLLLLGKGNMHAMLGSGYFQLGTSQAYFPWIIGGTLGILRLPGRRWPVALTAISFTLLFLAGNVWYTLPLLISSGLLALTHIIRLHPGYGRLDWGAVGRLALAGALTAGLCAVLLLPLWGNRDHIGDHPNTDIYEEAADFGRVVEQFYNGDVQLYFDEVAPGDPYFYYSFITPPWYALLLFVLIPPLLPFTYRPALPQARRVWSVGLVLVVAMTLWGAGGNPVIAFFYDAFPVLGQWRFVGRALAVASFWIAILLAMRADGLWRAILHEPWAERLARWQAAIRRWCVRAAQIALALALALVSLLAAGEVVAQWQVFAGTVAVDFYEESCLSWLREREPDAAYLAAYRVGYKSVTPFINHEVRLYPIEAAFTMLPDPPTIGDFDLTQTPPEYGIAWGGEDEMRMAQLGYEVIPDSPRPDPLQPSLICLYRRADPLSYAFSIPLEDMQIARAETIAALSAPITALNRLPDRIALHIVTDSLEPTVIAVQERAYPGWEVWVNGERWRLDSVGGLIGVRLPPDEGDYSITFVYRPPLLFRGMWISLFTAAFCALYLLRADVVLWRAVTAWRQPYAGRESLVALLGTGTPNADPERMGSAVAIVVNGAPYLVDCGPGVVRRAAAAQQKGVEGLAVERLNRLFITHLHSDHTAGLADLILTPWVLGRSEPLAVYGPPGTAAMTDHLLAAYAEDIRERLEGLEPANSGGCRVNVHEIESGLVYQDDNVRVEAFAVQHGSWPAYGYRFTTPDRVIVLSGDTCPQASVIDYARGCDLLIHEVYSAGAFTRRPPEWQRYHAAVHTSSRELGAIAAQAQPKLLVLYHQLFWGVAEEALVAEVRAGYNGRVVSGRDLDVF